MGTRLRGSPLVPLERRNPSITSRFDFDFGLVQTRPGPSPSLIYLGSLVASMCHEHHRERWAGGLVRFPSRDELRRSMGEQEAIRGALKRLEEEHPLLAH